MKYSLLFIIIGLIMSSLFSSGQIENPDTHLRLTQTRILLENLKLELPSDVGEISHGNIAINKLGQRFMVYNIGQSIIFLPLYYLSSLISNNDAECYYRAAFFVSFINYFVHAFCAMILFNIALILNVSKRRALLMSLFFCFTSYSFSFAQSTYEHHFEMLFILLAFYIALNNNIRKKIVFLSLTISFGLLFRTTTILVVPSILLLLDNRKKLFFLLSLIPITIFILIFNYLKFGNPFESGYEIAWKLANGQDIIFWSITRLPSSIIGFLFSPGKGLFFFSPTIIICWFGLKSFYAKNSRLSLSIIIFLLLYLCIFSMNFAWHGSIWSFGPRYILPILPFLYLPLVEVNLRKKWIYIFFSLGILSQVLLVSVNYKRDVLQEYIRWDGIDQDKYIYNLHKTPYIVQYKQLIEIIPKNFSGKLQNYFPDSPWKKENRIGTNQEVLEYSIEKTAINFWWVRVFLLQKSIFQRTFALLILSIAIILSFNTLKHIKNEFSQD